MERVMGLIAANCSSEALGSLTAERTIASLPFGGRYRLIDFPLSNMVGSGIRTVGLVMPYKYRSIIDHVGAGKEWGLDRKIGGLYILPGSVFGVNAMDHRFLLRDVRRNLIFLKRSEKQYVLCAGSNYVCNMDYGELLKSHIDSGAGITMLVQPSRRDDPDLLHVKTIGSEVRAFEEGVHTGDLAFAGSFLIDHDLLVKLLGWYRAVDYMDLFEAIAPDLDKIRVRVCIFDGYFRSIHTIKDYYDVSMELLDRPVRHALFSSERPVTTKILDTVPTKYSGSCRVENSLIPAGCNIRGVVKNSVLFRGVTVEEGAMVSDSVIMQNCVIRSGACVEHAILDRYNEIGAGMAIRGTQEKVFVLPKANRW
ncbi:MAG: glucose-1-phosphate adenylyltransferase subunit GlgD [Mogibacterium sp.]|nr:glucose-1-phosphate adenylyltransferase subunit GlgD [Mogibacterium sp.]